MATTDADAKTTVIETRDTKLANEEGNGQGGDSNEVSVEGRRPPGSDESVDGIVLGRAIEALESKKTKWWAYLATRDFWFVLALGYDDSYELCQHDLG